MANDAFYGMPLSENTRRFTVIRPAASGKTQPVDQVALERLREYVMMDLVGAGVLRTDVLPPRRVSIIADQVGAACAEWPRRAG
jgi:hypothetical protein